MTVTRYHTSHADGRYFASRIVTPQYRICKSAGLRIAKLRVQIPRGQLRRSRSSVLGSRSSVLGPRLLGAFGASLLLVVVDVFKLSCNDVCLAVLHLPSLTYSSGLAPFLWCTVHPLRAHSASRTSPSSPSAPRISSSNSRCLHLRFFRRAICEAWATAITKLAW